MSTDTSTELALESPAAEQITITTTPEVLEKIRSEAAGKRLAGTNIVDGKVIVIDAEAMVADKEGLKALKDFRMKVVVKQRSRLNAEHKSRKEDAWAECKRLDNWKNANLVVIAEIEQPLIDLEKAVEAELDRIGKEKAAQLLASRRKLLAEAGALPFQMEEMLLSRLDGDDFVQHLEMVAADKKRRDDEEAERVRLAEVARVEQERIAEEARVREAAQKAESERLAKIQAELDAQRAEQERLQAIQDAKNAAAQQEIVRAQQAAEESLRLQREELEQLRQAQIAAAEAVKNLEEKRQAEEREKIAAEKRALEDAARVQQEEADRLESERMRLELEAEQAEAKRAVSQMQLDAHEVLAPYEQMKITMPIQNWHIKAASELFDWVRGFDGECGPFDSFNADERISEITAIIHRNDPSMSV